jgi:hypothetical protein
MPIRAVDPRTPAPVPPDPPWSWTVAELGAHLTENQRLTLLARFRALGYDVHEWHNPGGTP